MGRIGPLVTALPFTNESQVPGLDAIFVWKPLVFFSAPRNFSPGIPVFSFHQEPMFDEICLNLIKNFRN